LMKLSFRAIGNTDTIEMAQVIISDFHYNLTQITDIQNGYVFLSPISANEDQTSPLRFTLNSYPNPFNPTTTIYLNNPEAQNVDAAIYNLKGQRVYDLHKGYLDSGEHHIVWNGQDQNGN
ncbi:MAG: T9SS type A sorting domain-containing protein, partial [Clostridiales bacterium]|nr:T9SS type A sorting domain-containing protein [Clostridiales bacterium]